MIYKRLKLETFTQLFGIPDTAKTQQEDPV